MLQRWAYGIKRRNSKVFHMKTARDLDTEDLPDARSMEIKSNHRSS